MSNTTLVLVEGGAKYYTQNLFSTCASDLWWKRTSWKCLGFFCKKTLFDQIKLQMAVFYYQHLWSSLRGLFGNMCFECFHRVATAWVDYDRSWSFTGLNQNLHVEVRTDLLSYTYVRIDFYHWRPQPEDLHLCYDRLLSLKTSTWGLTPWLW